MRKSTQCANKGALTPGTEKFTIDDVDLDAILEISENLKKQNYKFNPVRRIYIPKPGKKKKRPLGIPDFKDRLVQESIRIILSILYEPEFQRIERNFGFRPNRSVADAIEYIKHNSRGMFYAIEGDIEGAYDNVDQKVFIEILKKKIKDKKLTRLIESNFRAGLVDKGKFQHTLLGVPQGGISSPIFFNIYMHEFDKYVIQYLNSLAEGINNSENRQIGERARNKKYEYLRQRTRTILVSMKTLLRNKTLKDLSDTQFVRYKNMKKERTRISRKYRNMKSVAQNRLKVRFIYVRYADDWIILTNARRDIVGKVKTHLSEWLLDNLKLKLSEEKTKITDISKEKAHFLGFSIKNNQKYAKVTEFQSKGKTVGRRIAADLFIGIDNNRINSSFINKGYINENFKPVHNKVLQMNKPYDIIQKYRLAMEGLGQFYYSHLTFKSNLIKIYYFLKWSCYKTLASRFKCTVAQVKKKFGRNITFDRTSEYMSKRTGKIQISRRSINIPDWKDYMRILKSRRLNKYICRKDGEIVFRKTIPQDILGQTSLIEDALSVKANLRTEYKLKKYCPLCGALPTRSNPLESHHVRSIRKGKEIGFTKNILRIINMRQIVCCRQCHVKIHTGKYDGKALNEFYDPALIEL